MATGKRLPNMPYLLKASRTIVSIFPNSMRITFNISLIKARTLRNYMKGSFMLITGKIHMEESYIFQVKTMETLTLANQSIS